MSAIANFPAANQDSDGVLIRNEQFIRDLRRLKDLRSFLIQEAFHVKTEGPTTPMAFGKLNRLQYASNGREPTPDEWSEVELHTQALFRLLNKPLKRRFMLGEIPWWVTITAICLVFFALAALICAIVVQHSTVGLFMLNPNDRRSSTLPFYLVWLMSLGGIGSVAFIGMNAISAQQDITFDLTNSTLMRLRIVLGALFGLVLTLPFGFEAFVQYIAGVGSGATLPHQAPAQAILLLLPFVLGFSTSLVIMILNRLVDAAQAFFGRVVTSNATQEPLGFNHRLRRGLPRRAGKQSN